MSCKRIIRMSHVTPTRTIRMSHVTHKRITPNLCASPVTHVKTHLERVKELFFLAGPVTHVKTHLERVKEFFFFLAGPVTHVKTYLEGVKEFCATEGKVFHHVRQPLLVICLVHTPYVDHKAQLCIHVFESVKGRRRG